MVIEGIPEIRQKLLEHNRASQTSEKFQDDILQFIIDNKDQGHSIIEVGCFYGGFSSQLAFVAKMCNLTLDVIDIDKGYLNHAADTLEKVGLRSHATMNLMPFSEFVQVKAEHPKPVLVFIDGDHRYDGVVADIRAMRQLHNQPFACAFHDYSLRYADGPLTIVRVDQAVHDEFPADTDFQFIGTIAGEAGLSRTEPSGADRHFHERGKSEGVLITL